MVIITWRQGSRPCSDGAKGTAQGSASLCSVLTHPLEPLVPLQAEEGGSDMGPLQGESIVWSSMEVPYIATHNQVCSHRVLTSL